MLCCCVARFQCRMLNTMFMRICITHVDTTCKMTFADVFILCRPQVDINPHIIMAILRLWKRFSEVEQLEETNQAAARQVGRSCTGKIDSQVMKDGNVYDIHQRDGFSPFLVEQW